MHTTYICKTYISQSCGLPHLKPSELEKQTPHSPLPTPCPFAPLLARVRTGGLFGLTSVVPALSSSCPLSMLKS